MDGRYEKPWQSLETNSDFTPEKWWLGDHFPLEKGNFQGVCWF